MTSTTTSFDLIRARTRLLSAMMQDHCRPTVNQRRSELESVKARAETGPCRWG